MLELRKSDTMTQDRSLGRLLEQERLRTASMQRNREAYQRADLKRVMGELQQRFSRTGDVPAKIEAMVEAKVAVRTRELFRQANYDSLTHLPNRTYFNALLEKTLARAQAAKTTFSLLFLDLDGFKGVNDSLGHQVGDQLLQHVAARLVSSVREEDVVSRRGGDEFVILLTDLSDREAITGICERIIREVGRPYWLNRTQVSVSTSVGVACFPSDGSTPSELMAHSDAALYAAKSGGRKTFRFYDEIDPALSSDVQTLNAQLAEAITQGQMVPCLEPQVALNSQQVEGANFTVSWDNPTLATPYLSGWKETLMRSEHAYVVGLWMLDSALHYLQQWQAKQCDWVLTLPLLPSLWQKSDVRTLLDSRTHAYQVDRGQLQLEVFLEDLNRADDKLTDTLAALSQAGYQLTLSGVGAYPLDLLALSSLNVTEIKLDQAWLQASLQSENGRQGVKNLIRAARALDVSVIACGVDAPEQAAQLQSWGCSMAQGEAWSKPVSAERFEGCFKA